MGASFCRVVGSVPNLVLMVFLVGGPPKIIDTVVVPIAVPMSDLVFGSGLWRHESHSNKLVKLEEAVLLLKAERDLEISIVTGIRLQTNPAGC